MASLQLCMGPPLGCRSGAQGTAGGGDPRERFTLLCVGWSWHLI